MLSNYYTLSFLVKEWRARLHDMAIAQPFTQARTELVVPFQPVLAGHAERRFAAVVNCAPSQNALFFKENYARARRNTTDIFPGIEGSLVVDVAMHPSDRQVRVELRTGLSIVLQFFGPKANVLLVGPDGHVADAFLRSKAAIVGGPLTWPDGAQTQPDEDRLRTTLRADRDASVLQALKRSLPSFGPVLLRETIFRAGMEGRESISDLDDSALTRLIREASTILSLLAGPPRPRIYYREDAPTVLAPIPLVHLSDLRYIETPTVNDGVRQFIATAHRRAEFTRTKELLHEGLLRASDQAETTLRKIDDEGPEAGEADAAERHARLLQAHLSELHKGMKEAVVEDLFSDGREVIAIPLDPHVTPARNAERLFERARKVRTALAEQRKRRAALRERLLLLGTLIEELDSLTESDDLQAWLERHAAALRSAGIRADRGTTAKADERPPFRVFTVDGGFHVWAGKSGENNDLLSTRHTAKNDLWFHVRGISGSHVVLKMGTGRGEVSKRAKEQAAAIAAYYSKMKKARHVPVIMCEGKYVRKPKGAPAGTVTVERETVLFVDPSLPEGAEASA
jgi:predicted ribosome quality control (RQC) complex YloA/Tae2 family protein